MRGLVAAILLAVPMLVPAHGDDGPPSMIAIAMALRGGHPQDAEMLATQMMAAPNTAPLDIAYLHLNRGLARERLGHRDEAVADFTAAIDAKILPQDELARALFDRGVTLDETGHTPQAVADYSQAISLTPRYATALNNRGNAYRRTNKPELARPDYEAALAAGDDEPEYPLYGLGRIAEGQGDVVLAQSFYRKALAANGQYAPAAQRMVALGTVAQSGYAIHPPGGDAAVTVNEPAAAPTIAVAETGAAPQVDLHPPPVRASRQVAPRTPSKQAAQPFGLRPAILDTGAHPRPKSVRVASLTPPQLDDAAASATAIQLGAWREEADAANGWNHLVSRSGGLLDGLNPRIVVADIPGKGRYWRLRTVPAADTSAAALCAQLKAKDIACLIAKN